MHLSGPRYKLPLLLAALVTTSTARADSAIDPYGQAMRRSSVAPLRFERVGNVEYESEPSSDADGSSSRVVSTASYDEAVAVNDSSHRSPDLPISLTPPTERADRTAGRPESASPAGALTTVLSSLAVVVGLFLLVMWCSRRAQPKGMNVLPKEVVEVLGRATLAGRQTLNLVRVGNKLILLSAAPGTAETLTEITDPIEVDRLCGLCQQHQPGSITATFRQVLHGSKA